MGHLLQREHEACSCSSRAGARQAGAGAGAGGSARATDLARVPDGEQVQGAGHLRQRDGRLSQAVPKRGGALSRPLLPARRLLRGYVSGSSDLPASFDKICMHGSRLSSFLLTSVPLSPAMRHRLARAMEVAAGSAPS